MNLKSTQFDKILLRREILIKCNFNWEIVDAFGSISTFVFGDCNLPNFQQMK